jgi:hypothetical protein
MERDRRVLAHKLHVEMAEKSGKTAGHMGYMENSNPNEGLNADMVSKVGAAVQSLGSFRARIKGARAKAQSKAK